MFARFKSPVLLILLITVLIFWQFFFKGLHPFPGNFMLAWYEPWKTDYSVNGKIIIQHKPIAEDTFKILYPFKILAIEMIKKKEFPLWNPYNGAGMPLMAVLHPGFLNPFNLFFFILEKEVAWSFYIITQLFLLGFFTYLFCRSLFLSKISSFFGSLIFMFSGFVIIRLIYGEFIYVLATLPLLLYLIEEYISRDRKKILLLPIAILFLFFSGHPQMTSYVIITAFFYSIFRSWNVNKLKAKNKILTILSFFLVGFFLSSIQLFPTLELYLHANASHEASRFIINRFLFPASHLISIIIPNYFGSQATYNYWGTGDYLETVGYIGSIALFLSLFTYKLLKNKNPYVIFFVSVTILSILSAIDWPGSRAIFSIQIPIFSTGAPSRILSLTSFSIAVLAAIGLDNILNRKITLKGSLYVTLFFSSGMYIILMYAYFANKFRFDCNNLVITTCQNIALRNSLLETGIFTSFLLVFFLHFIIKRISKKIFVILIFLLITISGIYNSSKFLPFSAKEAFFPKNDLIKKITSLEKINRIFGFENANIKTNFATYFRYSDPNYFNPLYIKKYGELISYANTKNTQKLLRSDVGIIDNIMLDESSEMRRSRLFQILGVKYLVYKKSDLTEKKLKLNNILWEDRNWVITVNKHFIPKANIVSNFEVIREDNNSIKRLFDTRFDPTTSVILEEPVKEIINNHGNAKKTAAIKQYKENYILLESNSTSENILILSDNYYPGWKAYVDGKETKIYRANYTFRAIYLPEGKHEIKFIYEPWSFKLGIIFTTLSTVIYLLLLLRFRK